jgi:hypothetical protein
MLSYAFDSSARHIALLALAFDWFGFSISALLKFSRASFHLPSFLRHIALLLKYTGSNEYLVYHQRESYYRHIVKWQSLTIFALFI